MQAGMWIAFLEINGARSPGKIYTRSEVVIKLGALDAGFLYTETDRSPQHIASVQILELPEGVAVAQFVEQFKAMLLQRIHLVAYFTNKLQAVPFGLDHPVWVRDTAFDIDYHVHLTQVPAPGGRSELEATVALLHETALDRSKPLWDLWVLGGLEDGRIAYYNRAHHACLDGMAGQTMLQTIMDVTPQPREVEPAPSGFFSKTEQQTPTQLVAGAIENFVKFAAKQPSAWFNGLETGSRLWQRAYDPHKGWGAAADSAPRTRFNRAVTAKRTYATGEMSIAQVKRIAKATDTTINDVFLAACSAGLRRYFDRTGELPAKSLIAGCPVSLRHQGDDSTNNQVTMMAVSFATDEAEPALRLQKIAQSSRTAKGLTGDLADSFDTEVSIPGLPSLLSATARLAEASGFADIPAARLPFNLVVSNVPGPQQKLYSCGATMLTHYPVSIPAHTQGVNITVQSYAGQLYFSITACAQALQDPQVLRDDILAGLRELAAVHKPDLPSTNPSASSAAPQHATRSDSVSRSVSVTTSAAESQFRAA